jgi:hypothetical protein
VCGTYQQIIELSLLLVQQNFKLGGGAILVLPISTDKRKGRAAAYRRQKRKSCCCSILVLPFSTDERKGIAAAPTKEKEELLL